MADYATVKVKQGVLRGRKTESRTGGYVFSFQGVPYAKPPVGQLRFKPPQAPDSWDGVKDALKEAPVSAQIEWLLHEPFQGQEDCLYLNVYASEHPECNNSKKPVMVFIHGGGFSCGSGDSKMYGPDYLVDQGVVLVTINYRLGALGFLFLENTSISPNNGLRDQVAALRWVQENIEAFGGDPSNVTIFGESAGGASVQFHVLSPMSKGLFHKAIAQSGSVLNPWAMISPEKMTEKAFRLGSKLGCNTTDPQTLVSFLNSINAEDIVKTTREMFTEEEKLSHELSDFVPISENGLKSEYEAFLPNNPIKLMKEGKFNKVPYMTGITSEEGLLFVQEFLKKTVDAILVNENFYHLLPRELKEQKNIKEICSQVKKYYFSEGDFTEKHLIEYAKFFTDTWFLLGIHKTVNLLAEQSMSVYYYQFAFEGEFNVYKKFLGASCLPGASHIDDLGYLFSMTFMNILPKPNTTSFKMLTRMVKLWTNFAKTGKPISAPDDDLTIDWPPYTNSRRIYFNINTEFNTCEDLKKKSVDFWSNLLSSS